MTEIVIKRNQDESWDLPKNKWYVVRAKSTGYTRMVIRSSVPYCGCDDPVLYIASDGIWYDDYYSFKPIYEIIGPVNKIEVS